MNKDAFWQIIEETHRESGGDMERKCILLKDRLATLPQEDLIAFIQHFDAADARAYAWPLWGAAYVMHGGCSDDSFSDFRATLISHGREIYEKALADPESLVDLEYANEDDICYEGYQYVKYDVAKDKLDAVPERETPFPLEPGGEEWDEEDLPTLYPRLSAKYSTVNDIEHRDLPKKPWWKFW